MYVHHKDIKKFEKSDHENDRYDRANQRDSSSYEPAPYYKKSSQGTPNNVRVANYNNGMDDAQYNPWANDRAKIVKGERPISNRNTRSDLNTYTKRDGGVPSGQGPFMANHDFGETVRRQMN